MIIFPKKDIIPIILPQICFKDKYNDFNSYYEMNPSIYIDENGDTIILVRCINYKKFFSKEFTLYENKSNSVYYILKGKINNENKLDIEKFNFEILEFEYKLPIFETYWKGLEDIRFINKNTILVNVPELNLNGMPSIYKAELNNNKLSNFVACKPNDKVEKNWLPYFDENNEKKVIYNLNPFLIKNIENDDFEEIELTKILKEKLEGYHGSTNGIEINKYERLFLVHINKEKTIHRWLLFDIINKNIIVSEEFLFFKNSYIEFNCSLSKYNDRIFISIGVNDDKAYIIETCNDDILATFRNNEEKYPTIVTMLYDIRSMETSSLEKNNDLKDKQIKNYIDLSKQFLLKLPFPIIIFIDENPDIYQDIYNFRKDLGLLEKTCIYVKSLKETYYYKDLEKLHELQKKFNIHNINLHKDTPLYIMLTNNKFDCIDKALNVNPFNSSHFIWMDFGINHVAQNSDYIYQWINKVPDKIKQLCINPYIEDDEPKKYFQFIYHNMAATLFSGSIEYLQKYVELFKNKTAQIYNEEWYQLEEAVMTIVQRENPDLFDLFYGDYQGIISNYLVPLHNIDLIIHGLKKCMNLNKTKEAFHILQYCCPYFLENHNHYEVYLFIEYNIIINYYCNNNKLLQEVIDLINIKLNLEDKDENEKIHSLLEKNKENISYYENKILIKF